MEITKVGDSFQYLYNSKSKKVYSMDERTKELGKIIIKDTENSVFKYDIYKLSNKI